MARWPRAQRGWLQGRFEVRLVSFLVEKALGKRPLCTAGGTENGSLPAFCSTTPASVVSGFIHTPSRGEYPRTWPKLTRSATSS